MAALLGLHGHVFRVYWRWRCRARGGRPRLDPQVIELIQRMSLDNPLWGAPRIHGELLRLGFQLAQSSVSKYMIRRRGRPTQNWTNFLRNNAKSIAAIDLLTVRTATFDCLYAFVVLSHERRRILHVEVAAHATALWLACQMRETFKAGPKPVFVVRDNDGAYGASFRNALRELGIDDRPTAPHSPWQNGHVERLIGSIRRECLDHQLIWSASHLRAVLRDYADYYNNDRTHLALEKNAPNSRAVEAHGRIVSLPVLGGLHRRYRRVPGK